MYLPPECGKKMTSLVFPANSNCVLETKQGNMENLWRTKNECEKKVSLYRIRISVILSTSTSGR